MINMLSFHLFSICDIALFGWLVSQLASIVFLSYQISTSHQPQPAEQIEYKLVSGLSGCYGTDVGLRAIDMQKRLK